jgi:hypothetical protein
MTLYETGMKTRRNVLGEAHVARAEASKTDFDASFLKHQIAGGVMTTIVRQL